MYDLNLLYYNAVDLLKLLIETPSFSKEENKAADLIENYIEKEGLKCHRRGNNCWVYNSSFDDKKTTILLNSHIDTVKPVNGWTKNPFEPYLEDGEKLYGLGSNDAGASVVCLLHAFLALNSKEQNYNLIFLASCEEEISGKNGIELVLPELPVPAFALVGEPTGMHPAVAEKGLMVIDCTVRGRAGHAARNEGINAIYKAMNEIEWFRTFHFPNTSDLLGETTMNVTMISAGTQHNVVPDTCNFTVDIRTNEMYSNQEILDLIQKHTQAEVKARSTRLNSSSIALENPLVQRAIIIGKEPYGSPTLSDQALMKFPSLKMGPGNSERSHTADEFILLSEIREGLEYYIKLLDGLRL